MINWASCRLVALSGADRQSLGRRRSEATAAATSRCTTLRVRVGHDHSSGLESGSILSPHPAAGQAALTRVSRRMQTRSPRRPRSRVDDARPARDLDADLLVIPVFEDDDLADEPGLDARLRRRDRPRPRARRVTGKPYELFVTARPRLEGRRASRSSAPARAASFTADGCGASRSRADWPRASGGSRASPWCIAPARRSAPEQAAQVLAEGAVLANFDGGSYKTDDTPRRLARNGAGPRAKGSRPPWRRRSSAAACSASAPIWRASCRTSRATR